ncbi:MULTISPECIES: hypothetical protein [unclassified Bacteroides]|jgi:hypothetical protein|uniref:hypothetical protein n=1 Tax=unclassified Bacteroides TaxID=2646097 RepID=UPI000E8AAEE0|nr:MULTISPECIES: hypothetical protein [unclassified Bacteroides]RGN50920.1 hypothetical protein DXB63_03325 [Bacteroides sp. OM05-12]RHR82207.1 hypothetical protein DWW69_02175 [Bacteroides sp. AF16-49]
MKLNIYNQKNELVTAVSPSDNSTCKQDLMGDDVLNLSFTLPAYIKLHVNDYIDYEGQRYTLLNDYEPTHNNNQEYEYSPKFYGIIGELKKVLVVHETDGDFETDFSLDGRPADHLAKILNRVNHIQNSGKEWKAVIDPEIQDLSKTIEYKNRYCFDALNEIANTFETEWWIDDSCIFLSRCERDNSPYELGYGEGLLDLSKTENDGDVQFITRLIPLGSTRNIDKSSYGFSRLQLPVDENGVRPRYVEQNTQYGIYEAVEEDAFSEIYPRMDFKVTAVRWTEKTGEDGKPFNIYFFKSDNTEFDPNDHEIAGLTKHIVFQGGNLNGRDFEVNYSSTTKEFEIVTQFPFEGQQLPGGSLIPKEGDPYILYNISLPGEVCKAAEKAFQQAVGDYLKKYSEDVSVYKANTDYIYLDENAIDLKLGSRVKLKSKQYFEGGGSRDSRITSISKKINNPLQMYIECSHAVGKGRADRMESNINDIKMMIADKLDDTTFAILKTWDTAEMSNFNVLSALRTMLEIKRKALSRLEDDIAAGAITFNKEAVFKDGIRDAAVVSSGTGWHIGYDADGNSKLEVDKLLVRMEAVFRELVIEKLSHVGGARIASPARMKCTMVENVSEAGKLVGYRCFFDRGENNEVENEFKENDLARCQVFTGKGLKFYWRKVVKVGDDYIVLSDRNGEKASDCTGIPAAGDDICLCGNTGNPDRQNVIMETSYGSPTYVQYRGINSFTLAGKDVVVLSPEGNKFVGDFFSENGDNLLTRIASVEGKITSQISGWTYYYNQKNNCLSNGLFNLTLDKWEYNPESVYVDNEGLLFLNGSLYLEDKLIRIEPYGEEYALHLRNGRVTQLYSNFAKSPSGGPKHIVTMKYAVKGSAMLSFGFDGKQQVVRLTGNGEFKYLVENITYGNGNFFISCIGDIYISFVTLTLNEPSIGEIRSTMEQFVDRVNLSVTRGDLVSSINLAPEGVKISGNKVDITGATSFNGNVIIDDVSGSIKILDGDIKLKRDDTIKIDNDEDKYKIVLKNNGSGHLAGGNIKWDEKGELCISDSEISIVDKNTLQGINITAKDISEVSEGANNIYAGIGYMEIDDKPDGKKHILSLGDINIEKRGTYVIKYDFLLEMFMQIRARDEGSFGDMESRIRVIIRNDQYEIRKTLGELFAVLSIEQESGSKTLNPKPSQRINGEITLSLSPAIYNIEAIYDTRLYEYVPFESAKTEYHVSYTPNNTCLLSLFKIVNQNIIGRDGISVIYDTDNVFEVKKKTNGIVVRAKLPNINTVIEENQLYVDENGFVKINKRNS